MSLDLSSYNNLQQATFVYINVPSYGALRMSTYNTSISIQEDDNNYYTYVPNGILLSVSEFNNELTPSKSDVTISLTAIDQSFVSAMMNYAIKGSQVIVRRAFFDPATGKMLSIVGNPSKRFTGIIANYNFNDEVNALTGEATTTITVSCSNIISVLENKIVGQTTSSNLRRALYSNDHGFDRVATIATTNYDFGKPV
jgi:hypothetical protein